MSASEEDDRQARIAELERENAALRELVSSAPVGEAPARSRNRGRSIASAVLVVIALILTPLAIVAGLAKNAVSETDAFVATFAPLAQDPAVQATVEDVVVVAVQDAVDIPGLTSQVVDALVALDLPESASTALRLLEGPAAHGVQTMVRQVVGEFVRSEAFANVWRQTLAVSHAQMVATMTDAPGSAVSITADGALELNLRPIIAEVRSRLVDSGLGLAANIPDVDRSIVIAQSDAIRQAKLAYALVVDVGTWLPWVTMLLLAAGVLVAVGRRTTLMRAGVALAVLMLLLWGALRVGRVMAIGALSSPVVSADTAAVLYDTAAEAVLRATAAVGVLGGVIALVAYLSGPGQVAAGARATTATMAASVRAAGERHGLGTGAVGRFLDRYHPVALAVIIAMAIAVIAFTRPLTVGVVLWTLVLALLAVLVLQVARNPEPPRGSPAVD